MGFESGRWRRVKGRWAMKGLRLYSIIIIQGLTVSIISMGICSYRKSVELIFLKGWYIVELILIPVVFYLFESRPKVKSK